TYGALAERANRYVRWALDQGLAPGDVVCLLMPNRPEYMAIWLGISRVGGVVALVNTCLVGSSLAHALDVVAPTHIIVAAELVAALRTARPDVGGAAKLWVHGGSDDAGARLDRDVERYPGGPLEPHEQRAVTIEDRALYVYTSGTTGLPKAARVSH